MDPAPNRREREHISKIRQALDDKKLVIIVGAGVSLDAIQPPPPRITWIGLIQDGLDYLEERNFVAGDDEELTLYRNVLTRDNWNVRTVLRACGYLKDELDHHQEFPTWLDSVFGSLHQEVNHTGVFEALRGFHQRGARLMTTNFDELLEHYCGLERVRRLIPEDVRKYERCTLDGVFHIHGSFQDPQEVVLDPIGYYQVKASDDVQNLLKTYLRHNTILFVGCGSGLEDPNFRALLEWASNTEETIPNHHYLLARNRDDLKLNPLITLRYGSDYEDLVPYLNTLLEEPVNALAINTSAGKMTSTETGSGPVSSVSTLPGYLNSDPDFLGRNEILEEIETRLKKNSRIALAGYGGIGKTQIAVHFAHKFRTEYPNCHIFWVYAGTTRNFVDSYKEIAEKLAIPGIEDAKLDARRLVREWLEKKESGKWLMILDNADDRTLFYPQHQNPLNDKELQRYISTYLPECTDIDGAIIITTRDGRLGRELLHGEEPICVGPLAKADAEHLLRAKVKAEKWNPGAAEMLLAILVHTPLAITQAAAYINCTYGVSVITYLEMLQKDDSSMADVLGEDFRDHRRQAGVANAIFKTLKLSYEHIRNSPSQNFKTAADILSLMAILDSQSIPATLFLEGIEITPNERAAIQVLRDFCLIRDRDDHYSLHRLVQLSTQDWLRSRGELLRYQERGLLLLARSFPCCDDPIENRTICAKLLSQALQVLPYQCKNQVARTDLLHNVGVFERERGEYDAALKHAEECRVIRCTTLGEHHEKTLETEYLIGQILEELGKYPEAETKHRYVLMNRTILLGQDHQDTISSLDELAGVLGDQGKYKEAVTMQRRAVAGYVKNDPEDFAHISIGLNNLGHLLQDQGNLAEAGKVLRKALKMYEDTSGMDSREVTATLDNIGVLLSNQGKGVEAEKRLRQVLERREKILGRGHPDTLTTITNLAVALDTQQRYIEAEELHREALTGKVAAVREKHPDTLSTLNALAWNLHGQGKYEEAISLMRITGEGRVQILGADHPDSKRSCQWHAAWLKEMQERKEEHPNGKRGSNGKSLCLRERERVSDEDTQVHKRSRH